MVKNQTYRRMLQGALESLESAHTIANNDGVRQGDYHSLQAAATQAAQAARELNQLVGFVRAVEDVRRLQHEAAPKLTTARDIITQGSKP
jgi:hypothetical protein